MRTYPESYPSKTGMSPVAVVNDGKWKLQKCLIHGHKWAQRTMMVHEGGARGGATTDKDDQ